MIPNADAATAPILLADRHRSQLSPRLAYAADSAEAAASWRQELRGALRRVSGVDALAARACPPNVQEHDREDHGDHQRVWCSITTEPDYRMPFLLLVPPGAGPHPCLIASHGHGAGAGDLLGIADDQPNRERIERLNYAYALEAVRAGYVTVVPDKRGFGSRGGGDNHCVTLSTIALQIGESVIGWHTWDHLCLLDHLVTLPQIDADRIGAIGLSGGGGAVMWLAALDERIKASVISCHLQAARDGRFGCICNAVPDLLRIADRGDIAAAIAPRPLWVEAGKRDAICPPKRVDLAMETVRRAYAMEKVEDRLVYHLHEGEHRWGGGPVWEWLARWL